MLRAGLIALVALVAPLALSAQQAETLADIKQDMSVLYVELQKLRQELNTTGASDTQISGSALDRINTIEAELQRVTAKTEELEFRIGKVVQDGTNRLGDLDFRVCELEPNCDIGALGDTPRLGGQAVPAPSTPDAPVQAGTDDTLPAVAGELAVSEEADFREAQAAFEQGDYLGAAQLFATFRETYPQGPLEAAALIGEGRALESQGDVREAARRYLSAYSGHPEASVAPEALWRLGVVLGALGSGQEACVTLEEVSVRYPDSAFVGQAADSRAKLGCQ